MSERDTSTGFKFDLASRKIVAVLIAVLLLSIGVIGYLSMTSSRVSSNPLPKVEIGDSVYVNYVGYFPSNPGGWVFDTSERLVAFNDSIPKSLFFTTREPNEYSTLNFTAGVSTNLLGPFVQGVVGMTVTQTKTIYIPAEDAYSIQENNLEVIPLIQSVPVLETLTVQQFEQKYDQPPSLGLPLEHAFWEWDIVVWAISGDIVTIQNFPTLHETISSYGDPEEDIRDGWLQEVISIDPSANGGTGEILVSNLISSQDIYQKKGRNQNLNYFTLMEVDEEDGTFTVIKNSEGYIGEIAGRGLYFDITVERVLKA